MSESSGIFFLPPTLFSPPSPCSLKLFQNLSSCALKWPWVTMVHAPLLPDFCVFTEGMMWQFLEVYSEGDRQLEGCREDYRRDLASLLRHELHSISFSKDELLWLMLDLMFLKKIMYLFILKYALVKVFNVIGIVLWITEKNSSGVGKYTTTNYYRVQLDSAFLFSIILNSSPPWINSYSFNPQTGGVSSFVCFILLLSLVICNFHCRGPSHSG